MFKIFVFCIASTSVLVSRTAVAERCGPNDCGPGTSCCNYGCGICTPPEGACISLFCNWGRPTWIDADHVPSVDPFDRVSSSVSFANYTTKTSGAPNVSSSGISTRFRLHHRLAKGFSLRGGFGGSKMLDKQKGSNEETVGFDVGLGATYLLPEFHRIIGSAVTIDGEFRDGPTLVEGLGPGWLNDQQMGSVSGGLAFGDRRNAVPLTAHVRYVHSMVAEENNLGIIDAGVALSTELGRYLFWFGGKPVPFGLRLHYRFSEEISGGLYRAHEIGGGAYYFPKKNKVRFGIDVDTSFQRLGRELDGTRVIVLARADWYWDANF